MQAARKSAEALDALSAGLDRLAMWGGVAAIAVMLAAAGWQVFARYLLDQPPVWTEELARFSMVWGGLLGASCAFRAGFDPTLFPQMRKLRGLGGGTLAIMRAAGAALFIVPILWFSIFGANMNPERGYIARLAGRQAETMDVPMVIFGIAIPIAFSLIALHIIAGLAMRATDPGETIQEKNA